MELLILLVLMGLFEGNSFVLRGPFEGNGFILSGLFQSTSSVFKVLGFRGLDLSITRYIRKLLVLI